VWLLVQALPYDQMIVHEMCVLVDTLQARAPTDAQGGPDSLAQWLLDTGHELVTQHDAPLVTTFCRLVMWHHRRVASLRRRGASMLTQSFEASVHCGDAGAELPHLAFVMAADAARPASLLQHAQAEGQAQGEDESALEGTVVFVHDRFATYANIAKQMCRLCTLKVRLLLF
jgi:hypothetical protein